MSKKRDRRQDKNELEHYRGIIREQDKQIRQLTKQLKYFEKRHKLEELEIEQEQEIITEAQPEQVLCTSCSVGFFSPFIILDKIYGTCSNCGQNKRLK